MSTSAPAPDERPRQVPPAQALPEPAIGATQAAGVGLVAGTLATAAGTAAGVAATAPAVPLIAAHLQAIDEILERFRLFFLTSRVRQDRWLLLNMRKPRTVVVPQQDILDTIADENRREAEFERGVLERVRRDTALALRLPTAAQLRRRAAAARPRPAAPGLPGRPTPRKDRSREDALEAIIERERRFARQRSQAMAVRALSALDRTVLKVESPTGAFWKLDPNVRQHTPDCLYMARFKFWPWQALAIMFPPTHTGCRCSLHGYAEAIAQGWMRPRDVQDLADAMRRVQIAKAMLHEH